MARLSWWFLHDLFHFKSAPFLQECCPLDLENDHWVSGEYMTGWQKSYLEYSSILCQAHQCLCHSLPFCIDRSAVLVQFFLFLPRNTNMPFPLISSDRLTVYDLRYRSLIGDNACWVTGVCWQELGMGHVAFAQSRVFCVDTLPLV